MLNFEDFSHNKILDSREKKEYDQNCIPTLGSEWHSSLKKISVVIFTPYLYEKTGEI